MNTNRLYSFLFFLRKHIVQQTDYLDEPTEFGLAIPRHRYSEHRGRDGFYQQLFLYVVWLISVRYGIVEVAELMEWIHREAFPGSDLKPDSGIILDEYGDETLYVVIQYFTSVGVM